MSTDKKKHDFHLVDPSPWPIYVSFAAVPLYYLFCRVTGFGGTTQNASNK